RLIIPASGRNGVAFATALEDAMSRPEATAARLFSLRAENLLNDLNGATARARLSGLLIGAELAAARPYWLGQQVAVIGASTVSQIYGSALTAQGVPATIADGPRMTLAGLTAAYKSLHA
ncbi:MAG: 2-dehydro-3-deoxygalactonokinase, partial [Pseudomonadota bacterium]